MTAGDGVTAMAPIGCFQTGAKFLNRRHFQCRGAQTGHTVHTITLLLRRCQGKYPHDFPEDLVRFLPGTSDFSDYRGVQEVKIPFTIQRLRPGQASTVKFESVQASNPASNQELRTIVCATCRQGNEWNERASMDESNLRRHASAAARIVGTATGKALLVLYQSTVLLSPSLKLTSGS